MSSQKQKKNTIKKSSREQIMQSVLASFRIEGINIAYQIAIKKLKIMSNEKPNQIIEEHLLTDSSTNIKKSVYNHWEKTLTIVFQNDMIYKYLDVEPEVFEEYKAHESKGKAHMSIIKGKYEFEKIN